MSYALETTGLYRRFGGLTATNDVSLRLRRGARHALIGPNGAGKTTLINLLTGVLAPSAGRILLEGDDITRLRPDRRVRRGLVRTFQINQLFAELTPLMTVGLAVSRRLGLDTQIWRPIGSRAEVIEQAVEVLERFGLGGDEPAHGDFALWPAAAAGDCAGGGLRAAGAAAGRAGRRRARG